MTVRRANNADSESLLRLYRDLVGEAAIGGADALRAVLAHPGTEIWCAPASDGLAAMCTLHVLPNVTQSGRPYALIENVVTRRDLQGQGYGRLVMTAAIDAAWSKDAYKIMLLTGRTAAARGFYERLGFRSDEKWGMSMRRVPLRKA